MIELCLEYYQWYYEWGYNLLNCCMINNNKNNDNNNTNNDSIQDRFNLMYLISMIEI